MADNWMDPVAASLLAAARKANIGGKQMDQVTGYSWLVSKNAQLQKLPVDDARKQFEKLDISVQENIKQLFGDPEYSKAEPGLVGKAFNWVKKPFTGGADFLYTYGEIVSSPYRAARKATSFQDFISGKSWESYNNGERIFDSEREAVVDGKYDPNVAKIAKRISMGDAPGKIAGDLTTPEEEAAYLKYAQGDQEMFNAIRDYNDAKISQGRDWFHSLGLAPEIGQTDQGIKGKMYTLLSGTVDTAATFATAPEVWLAGLYKASHEARYGIMSMLSAEAGSFTGAQKMLTMISKLRLPGVTGKAIAATAFGIDAAFRIPKVRAAFEKIGPDLAIIGKSTATGGQKAMAMERVKNTIPSLTDRAIVYMANGKVVDADTAADFFRSDKIAYDVMMGHVGSMEAKLPVYSAITNIRSNVRQATRAAFGEKGTAMKIAGKEDTLLSHLETAVPLSTTFKIQELRRGRDWFARVADRALLRNYVNVEGDGVIDSAADVYAIARTFLGRPHARLVSNSFILAPDAAARRNIITGLYDNLGDFLGVKSTQAGADAWAKALGNIKNAKYSNEMVVNTNTARAIGMQAGLHDPSIVNDVSHAIGISQTTSRMALPKIQDLLKMSEKHMTLRSISPVINNSFSQAVTDAWSAMNLLPRLGIRSVLDEMFFHYLTLPVALLPTVAKGYGIGITQRIVRRGEAATSINVKDIGGNRDVGFFARFFHKMFANVTPDEFKAGLKNRQTQAELVHKNVTQARFGRLFKNTKNFENDAKYISQLTEFNLTNKVDDFSTGATAGIVKSLPENSLFDNFSEYANMNVDEALKDIKKNFGEDLMDISHTEPEFGINVLIQLANRIDGNGEIGKIAVRFMHRPRKAVIEIKKYLQTPEGKKVYEKFDRSRIQGRSLDADAKDFYLHVRSMLQNDSGDINAALLNKVRTIDSNGKELISALHLSLDDLGELAVAKELPRHTLGYRFRVPRGAKIGDMMANGIDNMYRIADRQIGTLTRMPVYNAYYLGYRRKFAVMEEKFYQDQMKINGMTKKVAREMAAKRFATIADNMAINRAIGFVDNPNVRSLTAFGMRNMARYYRATEDFWRRATRVVANSGPGALARMRLAYETLDHSGFIHEDEQGDMYFTFPVDTIMYTLTAPVVRVLTGDWPKQPMPLQLTGKIKMLTPSMDPSSSLPTLSSPMASITWGAASSMLNAFGGQSGKNITENIDTLLFGKYAENQDFIDMMLPMVSRRMWDIASVAKQNENNEHFISSAMKAAAFYSADPKYKMPTAESNDFEINQARYDIRATAFNLMFLRALTGIWSPVSPTYREGVDVPEYLANTGVKTMKREFTDILNAEREKGNPNAYSEAVRKFNKFYPGRLAYTVPESDLNTVGGIKKSKDAIAWIQKNSELVKMFPEGSVFLMPQMNSFDMNAYMYLKREGMTQSKDLETYYQQIATIADENKYFDIKNAAEKAAAISGDATRSRAILSQADAEAKAFLDTRPYLKLSMVDGGRGTILKEMALRDARDMLDSPYAPNNATATLLRKMIATYDSADATLSSVTSQTDAALSYKRTLRQNVSKQLEQMAGTDPNALEFYNSILKRLIEK